MTCLFNDLGPRVGNKLPPPLLVWFLQTGLRIAPTFTVGSVRVSVQYNHCQFKSPECRNTTYITFTCTCLSPRELKMNHLQQRGNSIDLFTL